MSRIEHMIDAIRSHPGVTRKNSIHEVVDRFPTVSFPQVYAAEGEDAAVLDVGDRYVLFATDGIMQSLVEVDPFLAGYFAVLVNVNDIAAMGGRSIGMVDVMSMDGSGSGSEIIRGMQEGIRKFGVPIVGGHTHPDCTYNAVDIAITGVVDKGSVLLSSTAQPGDDIVFVIDIDGYYLEELPLAFITTIDKDDAVVRDQMEAVAVVADEHLAHACKDMSNPGHVGTLGMMLESSGMGGIVDITKIPIPDGVDEIRWALSYQGCAFIFSCCHGNSDRIIDLFSKVGCKGAIVGSIDDTKALKLTDGKETKVLFDFTKDIITGCGQCHHK